MDELRITALGGLTVTLAGRPVTGLASRKTMALLLYLIMNSQPQPREVLANIFWDDRSQDQALANLRVVLSSLRKELGEYIEIGRDNVGLKSGAHIFLDVHHLELSISTNDNAKIETALCLYQMEFLEGFFIRDARRFDAWAQRERERLHQMVVTSLKHLITVHLQAGRYHQGINLANRLLSIDPLLEFAHRQLIMLLALSGQRIPALAQYEQCRDLLERELGINVSRETAQVAAAIRAGTFGFDAQSGEKLNPVALVYREKPIRAPQVLTPKEIKSIIANMTGVTKLIAGLIYGSGLHFNECMRLRAKDLDFDNHQIIVRNGRDEKKRITILPTCLIMNLRTYLRIAKDIHQKERYEGLSAVSLPYALTVKHPETQTDWNWQYIFPLLLKTEFPHAFEKRMMVEAISMSTKAILQREIRNAAGKAGIKKGVSPRTFRRSFAVHLLQYGYEIRIVQKLLGHKDIMTTMRYTYRTEKGSASIQSPLDL